MENMISVLYIPFLLIGAVTSILIESLKRIIKIIPKVKNIVKCSWYKPTLTLLNPVLGVGVSFLIPASFYGEYASINYLIGLIGGMCSEWVYEKVIKRFKEKD